MPEPLSPYEAACVASLLPLVEARRHLAKLTLSGRASDPYFRVTALLHGIEQAVHDARAIGAKQPAGSPLAEAAAALATIWKDTP